MSEALVGVHWGYFDHCPLPAPRPSSKLGWLVLKQVVTHVGSSFEAPFANIQSAEAVHTVLSAADGSKEQRGCLGDLACCLV